VNALNVSIRHSPADRDSLLRWAPVDVFSFVLFHKQRNTPAADLQAGEWTRQLVDAALDCGGRHYLPYRLHATPEQFLRAYPEAREFAALKSRIDPGNRFRNQLWDRYLGAASG
jgi:FAD/FMN-containing dehydrogenase